MVTFHHSANASMPSPELSAASVAAPSRADAAILALTSIASFRAHLERDALLRRSTESSPVWCLL